jgi:uncharacterized protein
MEQYVIQLLTNIMKEVAGSIIHNWIPLSLAILTAAIMRAHINPEKMKVVLLKKTKVSIVTSVAIGALTPLCACGTMGVIIGMLTTALPWGPIIAFLTSSPLMSPDGFIMIAGIINMKFAVALTAASIIIGLVSGFITHLIETKTVFLYNQSRFADKKNENACACTSPQPTFIITPDPCNCSVKTSVKEAADDMSCSGSTPLSIPVLMCCSGMTTAVIPVSNSLICFFRRIKFREIADGIVSIGLKQILLFFALFIAVGYLINYFVPASLIVSLFGGNSYTSVPLAAIIGLPLYVSGESAVPLIKTLMSSGASEGSMLAFLITGPGTSAWVIAGIATFMKRKVIALYVGFLLTGGIILGYLFDFILAATR